MKRSDRLIGLTNYFINHPKKRINLSSISEKYTASKSSISEDLDILNKMFIHEGIGKLKRTPGAHGGTVYMPSFDKDESERFIGVLCDKLEEPARILPGGYLYMSDLLGDPNIMKEVGKAFVTAFVDKDIDAVVTVETKGIPIAYALANFLNVPVVIIRRNLKVTEGSSVSINYVSGQSQRIQTMVLPKRNLQPGLKVCIVDDFMKAGGTITGMMSLLEEFAAEVVGIGVLAESIAEGNDRVIDDYLSLIQLENVNEKTKQVTVRLGSYFQ